MFGGTEHDSRDIYVSALLFANYFLKELKIRIYINGLQIYNIILKDLVTVIFMTMWECKANPKRNSLVGVKGRMVILTLKVYSTSTGLQIRLNALH